MKAMNNNLDERQEQTLLKIEHNGCWFAFWALLASLIIEQFIFGFDFKYIAAEWIIFMALAIYMMLACIRNGIWDRRLKADRKTNLLVSAIAGVAFGALLAAGTAIRFPGHAGGSAAAGLIGGVSVFALCFIVLSLMAKDYKKRKDLLEQEPEEEDE